MIIRNVINDDLDSLKPLYISAFGEEEGKVVGELAVQLHCEASEPPILSLVTTTNDKIVGNIIFNPCSLTPKSDLQVAILAPLAVQSDLHKNGIGSNLIDQGLSILKQNGINVVLVYGDPDYYGRFGFNTELAEKFSPPHKLEHPFGWQALSTNDVKLDEAYEIQCAPSLNQAQYW